MSRQVVALYLGAVVVALLLAGCGDDGDGLATVQVTKAAFVRGADASCTKAYNRIKAGFQAYTKSGGGFSDPGEVRYADTILIPAKQQQVDDLRALGAPSGDEDEVEAIVDAYQEGVEKAEEDPQAAVTSAFGVFAEANELGEEYGLAECR